MLTIPKLINTAESIALDTQLVKEINPSIHIISYIDIYKDYHSGIQDLSDLYRKYNTSAFLIIFEKVPNIGHWGVLFRRNSQESVFYESYGFGIAKTLSMSDYSNRMTGGMNVIRMMLGEGNTLDENFFKHQAFDSNIKTYATCGFHSLSRVKFWENSNKDYNTFITSLKGISADAVVCLMLIDFLRK